MSFSSLSLLVPLAWKAREWASSTLETKGELRISPSLPFSLNRSRHSFHCSQWVHSSPRYTTLTLQLTEISSRPPDLQGNSLRSSFSLLDFVPSTPCVDFLTCFLPHCELDLQFRYLGTLPGLNRADSCTFRSVNLAIWFSRSLLEV